MDNNFDFVLSDEIPYNINAEAVLADMSPTKGGFEGATGRWTREEHKRFLEAMNEYGKNWRKVQEYVGTRSTTQVRSHAQKYLAKQEGKNYFSLIKHLKEEEGEMKVQAAITLAASTKEV